MHHNTYNSFKVLGIMLCYPSPEWISGIDELAKIIEDEKLLSAEDILAVKNFSYELKHSDLFSVQENYVDTFDRIRSLSLHLFEHVHGESRDRGQAMIDLLEVYKEKGMELGKSELPDYLPVFLEYLSLLPKDEAIEMLTDTVKILKSLGKRLAERGSNYSVIFNSLIKLAGEQPEKVEKKSNIITPSFQQIDKEWEEKPVDFMGAEAPKSGGCGGGGCGSGGCGGGIQKPIEKTIQGAAL